MKTLFVRTLIAFFFALLIFLLIVSLVLRFSIDRSMQRWTAQRRDETQRLFSNKLLELLAEKGISDPGELALEEIHFAFRPHLRDSLYLFVITPGGDLLYGYRRGVRLDSRSPGSGGGRGPRAAERLSQEEDIVKRHFVKETALEVIQSGRIVALLSAGPISFDSDRANRGLVESIGTALVTGVGIAFFMAILFAFLFSFRLSGHAKNLSKGLNALAAGERSVQFQLSGSRELRDIAASATVLRDRLKKEEELRRAWAADIAHDLRTPITAVKAQLEGFMEGVLEPTEHRLALSWQELLRMEKLVDDLAMLTRLETPGLKLEPEKFKAADFLEELKGRFLPEAEGRGIVFRLDYPANETSLVADRDLLMRAISNLVHNALQYCSPGGEVELALEVRQDKTLLLVRNDGFIPEQDLPLLFDRLFRGEWARHSSGSGLGLSIARAIADLHHGGLTVRNLQERKVEAEFLLSTISAPYGGSSIRFSCTFPVSGAGGNGSTG